MIAPPTRRDSTRREVPASAAVQSATSSEIAPPASAKEELDPPATTTDNSFDHYFLVFQMRSLAKPAKSKGPPQQQAPNNPKPPGKDFKPQSKKIMKTVFHSPFRYKMYNR